MTSIFSHTKATVLKKLVQIRLDDAKALLNTRFTARLNGAIYLGGYAVECAIKARICNERGEAFLRNDDKTHDLAVLFDRLKENDNALQEDINRKIKLKQIANEWNVELRYKIRILNHSEVSRFLDYVEEFVQWLSEN